MNFQAYYNEIFKNDDDDTKKHLIKKLEIKDYESNFNNINFDRDYLNQVEKRRFCDDMGTTYKTVKIKNPDKKYPAYFTMQELYNFCLDKNNKPSLYRFLKSKGIHRTKVFKEMLVNYDYRLDIYCNITSAFLHRRNANKLSGYTSSQTQRSIKYFVLFRYSQDCKFDKYKSKIARHLETIENDLLCFENLIKKRELKKQKKANQKKANQKKANHKNTPDHTQVIPKIKTIKATQDIKVSLIPCDTVGIKNIS